MDVEDFLNRRGIFPEAVQPDLGRSGLSASLTDLMVAAELRLREIDRRIEVVRHLLIIAQPRRIGRLEVTWQRQNGRIRPRVIQWKWARKTQRWLPWYLPDVQLQRHLKRSGPFRVNHDLSQALISLLGHLLRKRTELLRSIRSITLALKLRTAHDPFRDIDAALDSLTRKAAKAPLV